MTFDYHHQHTTRQERLAYLDGWALERIDCAPQFRHYGEVTLTGNRRKARGFTADLSDAFEAGKRDAS